MFQQCRDLIAQSPGEGFCRAQQRKHIFKSISFSTLRSTVANSWKEKKYYYPRKNYIKTQNSRRDRKERQQMKNDVDMLGRLPVPNQSPPVKQIKLESGGSAAKSWAESKSIAGTKIIPHSSVVLTNPGSACATLPPWDNMTPPKTETGRDSKQRGPDSVERNPCQDYL